MTEPGRRREDEFGFLRRNAQLLIILASIVGGGAVALDRLKTLKEADDLTRGVNSKQWEQISDLKDRVARLEGRLD